MLESQTGLSINHVVIFFIAFSDLPRGLLSTQKFSNLCRPWCFCYDLRLSPASARASTDLPKKNDHVVSGRPQWWLIKNKNAPIVHKIMWGFFYQRHSDLLNWVLLFAVLCFKLIIVLAVMSVLLLNTKQNRHITLPMCKNNLRWHKINQNRNPVYM